MNSISLINNLAENREKVEEILIKLGYEFTFDSSKQQYRFARINGSNPTSTVLSLKTLNYFCFSNRDKGNIISLVMKTKAIGFYEAIQWIANVSGFIHNELSEPTYPFGGFYKEFKSNQNTIDNLHINTLDEEILKEYRGFYNLRFLKDGISFETQKEFDVGYDLLTNRLTIPIRTIDGELFGIMGRLNDSNCSKEERWLPIIPCSRSNTLFGYCQNFEAIKNKDFAIVGESEKFVMQLKSFGCNIGLASCGNKISSIQSQILKQSFINKIVLAYDEGLEEDYIRQEAERIKLSASFFENKVGYIFDRNNELLKKGSKDSPSDHGKEFFMELMKKHVIWI